MPQVARKSAAGSCDPSLAGLHLRWKLANARNGKFVLRKTPLGQRRQRCVRWYVCGPFVCS
jgi:hypothetical protein